ncbi:protoplasts-secreted [Entomophthora muscae]|uniref:Protoplasts-secreted n=1 Tax=Entomophthora muscae TaxID=34485 RepID=A0ACC2UCE1_9FUNG|nr:protoplasts-secreted [Entomophthora muscae]
MKSFAVYLLSASVLGQCDKNFDINSAEGLQDLAKCSTVEANVNIDIDISEIKLPALKKVKGDFFITGQETSTIELISLEEVNGHFKVYDSLALDTLDVSKLAEAKEFSILNSGSNLALDFKAGLKANRFTVSHSRVKSLNGLKLKEVELLNISGNTDLELVNIPDLQTVNGPLTFEANPSAALELLNLTIVKGQLTLTGSMGAKLPKLKTLGGALSLDNTQFETISFEELTSIGQFLSIAQNDVLKNVSFPALGEIKSSLNIQNNGKLVEIHFPMLKATDGFTILEGSAKVIELNKEFVSPGAANVTAAIDCDEFKKNRGDAFANVACKYSEDTPNTGNYTTGNGKPTSSKTSTTTSSDARTLAGFSLLPLLLALL